MSCNDHSSPHDGGTCGANNFQCHSYWQHWENVQEGKWKADAAAPVQGVAAWIMKLFFEATLSHWALSHDAADH